MTQQQQLRFGVDLVTFYHPGFWDLHDFDAISAASRAAPREFWQKMLDAAARSGVSGIELTFSPFSWEDAVAAFGSAQALHAQLESRGLEICSGFFAELARAGDITQPEIEAALIARAKAYAEFLSGSGAGIMVVSLPMLQSPEKRPVDFLDLARAERLAAVLNRLGAAVADHGVQLALHTEAHSLFCTPRDVDLLLLLTDPRWVHFCPDTAHIILTGGDPLQLVDRHHERMVIAHWKDAIGPMPKDTAITAGIHEAHRPYFRRFGAGCVNWQEWAGLLEKRKFSGWAILELDASANPVTDISAGLQLIRRTVQPSL